MKKLAIVTTHPIQYYAPLFQLIADRRIISCKVFYTWNRSITGNYDPGFNTQVEWDIDLLKGYDYEYVPNTSKSPGSHHFFGITNPTLIKQIENYQPDAVLVFGWKLFSHLKVIFHFFGKKIILFRGDSTLLDENTLSIKWKIKKQVLKWIYRHVDYFLVVGHQNRLYFESFSIPKEKLILAPHAIDNHRFSNPTIPNYLRTIFHLKTDTFLVLFSGKFTDKKDPLTLINAFIEANLENGALVFVGNGELEPKLKSRSSGYANIFFLDFQNQSMMPSVYADCDVFVLPSKGPGETWGLAINEAMAAGKPVICSDKCGGGIDLVIEGENGYICKAGDEIDLAEKIRSVNTRDHCKMGEKSITIIQDFSFKNTVDSIENLVIDSR